MDKEVMRALFPKTMPWRVAQLSRTLVDLMFWWKPKEDPNGRSETKAVQRRPGA